MPTAFSTFFRQVAGFDPYDFQRELGARASPPSVLEVPTGAGKTLATLVPWLADRRAPRRLVYALPMRTLVEQTAEVVREAILRSGEPMDVHVLMGGEPPTDWAVEADRRAVLVGSVDMLLSRALNRGYGESRFRWPVSFGLLHNDCRWIFDEVQLMGPARATSTQLDGLRAKLGTLLPCESTWVSATVDRDALQTVDRPELGDVVTLSEADRTGPLRSRLEATKTLERVDVTGPSKDRPATIANAVLAGHRPGTRSIVVLNRVRTAQDVEARLRRIADAEGPRVVLLHSRFRRPDRAQRLAEALAAPDADGTIVVTTQVLEAGVDLSCALLATETAPFSAIVQRVGRCNRAGELADARVAWLDGGAATRDSSPPYHPEDLDATRGALIELVGESLSPTRLERITVPEIREQSAVLRRRDLLDLFDTTADLAGADVDVAPYIRLDDERTVDVTFRDVAEDGVLPQQTPTPARDEVVSVPVGDVAKRTSWAFDHVDGAWVRTTRPAPGRTLIVRAADGGYDPLRGWTGLARDVPPVLDATTAPAEGMADDPRAAIGRWVTLTEHLVAARDAAQALADALAIDERQAGIVVRASALHDVGKAHAAFQAMLRSTLADGGDPPAPAHALWAKSAGGRGRHVRRFFRHELASALALRDSPLVAGDASLVRYLVAAHHGRVRTSIRPAPDERPPEGAAMIVPFALGVVDGDTIPAVETPLGVQPETTLSMAEMEFGGTEDPWTERALVLLERHGPFALAYLEALVRVADWRASGG